MKKALLFAFAIFTVFSMAFVAITPVAAKSNEKSITIISATYIHGKGIVFKFKVVGEFDGFRGQAFVGGQKFALDCSLNDNGNLACLAESGMKEFIGQTVSANVNGFIGSAKLHNARYCYQVYDYAPNTNPSDPANWAAFTSVCQDTRANDNDLIMLVNPAFSPTILWPYFYQSDLNDCAVPLPYGNGYAFACHK